MIAYLKAQFFIKNCAFKWVSSRGFLMREIAIRLVWASYGLLGANPKNDIYDLLGKILLPLLITQR